ncbi:putative TOS1-like glycosyl hydrolase-domain-containing protein [Ilyonectria destructans]|nr:putative TOS1-like glycosyl hydrolase-domain-containing protein [Ilyonectria destructans]
MKYTTAIVLASTGLASALTQQCTGTAAEEGGNWFCGAIEQILYEGFSGSGSYKEVTNMGASGECETKDTPYSGPLAPLDEDLSVHIRGPINFKEFAVYNLASEKKKRDVAPSPHVHARRHGHEHFHEQRKKKRAEWITATIDGKVVSWENNYFGPATAVAPVDAVPTEPAYEAPAAAEVTEPVAATTTKAAAAPKASTKSKSSSKSGSKSKTESVASGDWERTSYYNAADGVAENIVFLGNYGGEGSGVFDTVWGNSLSYLNANGDGGSANATTLEDVLIPSNKEFAIFTAEECDDNSCGYSRAKDVAYKGFAGANKVFLFHFKMPLDGDRSFNGDMPALWALNARIPRTAQYSDCSCWTSGCGEADIYEVLASGDTKCKSTFHLKNGAGSSDYFDRPTDSYIKVATVFYEKTASVAIKQLPADFDFSTGLSSETIQGWISGFADSSTGSSLFQLST